MAAMIITHKITLKLEQELEWRMMTLHALGLSETWVGSRSHLCCIKF